MNYNVITGLEGQRQSAESGTGPDGMGWYVPPPPYGATAPQLQYTLQKLYGFKENIQNVIISSNDSSTYTNGNAMIAVFDLRIREYQAALSALNVTPVPEPDPVRPEDEFPIDPTAPPPTTPTKSNMPLYLIGGGLVLLFLYANSRKKKKVTGKGDEVLPVVLGFGALLLLTKKKETTPVVVVDPGTLPAPEPVQEQSTFLR